MPTPLDILLDPISLSLLALYLVLILLEALFPARDLPKAKHWKTRTFCSFMLFFYLSSYLPLLWDTYFLPYQLIDLSHVNPLLGAFAGLLVFNFLLYWWHRAIHKFTFLWRVFHQFHHSAERVDAYGAFYFSPMDIIAFTFLGSVALVLLVGLSAQAASLYLYASMFLPIFQHMNVRTPTWLGYIIQRPESHSIHHKKGVHAHNYADLPIFDIIFGTFKNPASFEKEAGYYLGASSRIAEMLLCRDVSKPKQTESHQGA
ncbi:sterol desaturase family protein [Agaribacter flavus]|uniref:Sterol desaturase family protein n=1 Tax=Agaribacter flavus TaxID=1902781 RepID=A0ABV7FWK6_9ALTE